MSFPLCLSLVLNPVPFVASTLTALVEDQYNFAVLFLLMLKVVAQLLVGGFWFTQKNNVGAGGVPVITLI